MSRSGYSDSLDNWDLIRWRGAVASAMRGKRGQAFLREMLAALDALPEKKLIAHELQNEAGEVCAIGSVGRARGMDMKGIDVDEPACVGSAFGIPRALAAEIEWENDEATWRGRETPEERFGRVRQWVAAQISKSGDSDA